MNKLLNWIDYKWAQFQLWLDSWQECPKESMGYLCHHRTLSNGQKECGEWQNYWQGDHE